MYANCVEKIKNKKGIEVEYIIKYWCYDKYKEEKYTKDELKRKMINREICMRDLKIAMDGRLIPIDDIDTSKECLLSFIELIKKEIDPYKNYYNESYSSRSYGSNDLKSLVWRLESLLNRFTNQEVNTIGYDSSRKRVNFLIGGSVLFIYYESLNGWTFDNNLGDKINRKSYPEDIIRFFINLKDASELVDLNIYKILSKLLDFIKIDKMSIWSWNNEITLFKDDATINISLTPHNNYFIVEVCKQGVLVDTSFKLNEANISEFSKYIKELCKTYKLSFIN